MTGREIQEWESAVVVVVVEVGGGESWLLPPWQPCVFVSARESDKQ